MNGKTDYLACCATSHSLDFIYTNSVISVWLTTLLAWYKFLSRQKLIISLFHCPMRKSEFLSFFIFYLSVMGRLIFLHNILFFYLNIWCIILNFILYYHLSDPEHIIIFSWHAIFLCLNLIYRIDFYIFII